MTHACGVQLAFIPPERKKWPVDDMQESIDKLQNDLKSTKCENSELKELVREAIKTDAKLGSFLGSVWNEKAKLLVGGEG